MQGLEQVGGFGGKAVALAEGMLYADDPNFYRTRLAAAGPRHAGAGPRRSMQRWLTRPVLAIRVDPGEREAYEEAPGVTGARAAGVQIGTSASGRATTRRRSRATSRWRRRPYRRAARGRRVVRPAPALDFPDIERARLSNGIQVVYARRTAVPVTRSRSSSTPASPPTRPTGSAPRR